MKTKQLLFALLLFMGTFVHTQLIAQHIVTRAYLGPTQTINNSIGTLVGYVSFTSFDNIPTNHKIVDVAVEIVWSKDNTGNCSPIISGQVEDQSHVGFILQGPTGGIRYLAASAATANSTTPATTASFAGTGYIIQDTIVFKDGATSLLPARMPRVLERDTVSPNNDALSFYTGKNPMGVWRVGGINDASSGGIPLCIHSYHIRLTTSTMNLTGIASN